MPRAPQNRRPTIEIEEVNPRAKRLRRFDRDFAEMARRLPEQYPNFRIDETHIERAVREQYRKQGGICLGCYKDLQPDEPVWNRYNRGNGHIGSSWYREPPDYVCKRCHQTKDIFNHEYHHWKRYKCRGCGRPVFKMQGMPGVMHQPPACCGTCKSPAAFAKAQQRQEQAKLLAEEAAKIEARKRERRRQDREIECLWPESEAYGPRRKCKAT